MKTKNAFALKCFDKNRILRHISLFEDTQLWDSLGLDATDADYLAMACENRNEADRDAQLKEFFDIIQKINQYQARLTRHIDRLARYANNCLKGYNFDYNIRNKISRAQMLSKKYADISRAMRELVNSIFSTIDTIRLGDIEKIRRRFSERLRQARKEKGMTQQDVAKLIPMSGGGYTQYELARRDPSIPTLVKLAKIFDCSVDWLLGLKP